MYQSHSYPDSFLPSPWSIQSSTHPQDHNNNHYHLHRPPSSPPGTSPPSDNVGLLLQRSSSTISLQKHVLGHRHHRYGGATGINGGIRINERADFFDFPPIRRVFSTGDIRAANTANLRTPNGENCAADIAGGVRVGRYNAEERRERIERYRSKRNQRNYQKKITYVCRKTLADSRPRIRGRFARNGEAELEIDGEGGELSSARGVGEEECCDPDFWANFLDNLSVSNIIA